MTDQYGQPEAIVDEARQYAIDNAPTYFEFARKWPVAVQKLIADTSLAAHLAGALFP